MLNWKDFRPLFMEKTGKGDNNDGWDLSLGRIAFWVCFVSAVYFWLYKATDIQPSHMQMLYIMAVYNLAKKAPMFSGMINISSNNVGGNYNRTDGDNNIVHGGSRPDIRPPIRENEEQSPNIRN